MLITVEYIHVLNLIHYGGLIHLLILVVREKSCLSWQYLERLNYTHDLSFCRL